MTRLDANLNRLAPARGTAPRARTMWDLIRQSEAEAVYANRSQALEEKNQRRQQPRVSAAKVNSGPATNYPGSPKSTRSVSGGESRGLSSLRISG